MLRSSALRLAKKWNQGSGFIGVNDAEPWHPMGNVYSGESLAHRRVLPSFMKDEYDFDTQQGISPLARNWATMYGGAGKYQWMRSYQKLYEQGGGARKRTHFKATELPLQPDLKLLPRTKGYRDAMGFFHEDPEQLITFTMPDMSDSYLRPYVK